MSKLGELQKHLLGALLLFATVAVLPLFIHERYILGELITLMLWASVAVQWNVLMGHAGVFSLAQMLLFAIGSYTVAMLATYLGISPWFSIPLGACLAAAAALVIGIACLRLATAYVALLTFAIAYMIYTLIITQSDCYSTTGGGCNPFFGGTNGFAQFEDLGFRRWLKGNWLVGNYIAVLTVFALSFFASIIVIHGRLGLAFRTISDSAIYAASRGINRTKFQIIAFVVTAFFTGMTGAMHATHFRFSGPSLFDLSTLFFILSMVIVGGLKSTWGPVFGAVLMTVLVEVAKSMGDIRNSLIGAVLVLFVLLLPKGIAGAANALIGKLGASDKKIPADESKLEPAIPEHLRTRRTLPLNAPENCAPVTPSYSARFAPHIKALPMAYFGVQYLEGSARSEAAIAAIETAFRAKDGPSFWDRARHVDELGYTNIVSVGYWDSRDMYERWQCGLARNWWYAGNHNDGDVGCFRECYTPSVEDTETTFSHRHAEGYSKIASHMSGMTDTHGYWGSARDRIARSQSDAMDAQSVPRVHMQQGNDTLGRHIIVEPHENLCLLRSGQDWTEAGEEERAFYLERVKPALDRGMIFIRDEGKSVGCYFNRYMDIVATAGIADKTFSLSAWHSLKDLETWVKTESHLEIFAAGTRHYRTFEDAKLRLYHEMSVIHARDQQFEYFNCHHKTGMLNAFDGRLQTSAPLVSRVTQIFK